MLSDVLLLMSGGDGAPDTGFFLFMGAIMIVMYFFFIRPQSKKANAQKTFIEELKKGSKIVTIGGIHAKVVKVDADSLLVEVDTNTKLRIEKSSVSLESTEALLKRSESTTVSDS